MGEAASGRPQWVRRTIRSLILVVLVVMVALGGYAGYAAIRAAQPVTLPAPTGPHAIGRTTVEWTDNTRTDPLAPQPDTPRKLSVWLWYPAAPGTDAQPAPYTPDAWAGLHLSAPVGWGETSFDNVHVHAVADAPVAAGRFPLVVLEPGLGTAAPQYTTIAEDLASHGYLVAGVTPTYSANLTVLDGHAVPATTAGDPPESDDLTMRPVLDRLVDVWAADARFAATQIAGLDTSGRFAGHVNTTTTVYMGHSFGGAAALQACPTDPHCAGAADLDGTQYGTVVHSGLAKPIMLLGSENSCVTGTCQPAGPTEQASRASAQTLLAASTGPFWCYQINGAQHFNFSDYGTYYLAAPIRSIVGLGAIDGNHALTITNAFLTAFADHVTQGRPEPLLTGPSTPYPEVDVQHTAS